MHDSLFIITVVWVSVIDPLNATIGVGLGLPGYSPGAADRSLMHEALRTSEIQALEEAMLKDKIKLSDYERTEQEINEQVYYFRISVLSNSFSVQILPTYCSL